MNRTQGTYKMIIAFRLGTAMNFFRGLARVIIIVLVFVDDLDHGGSALGHIVKPGSNHTNLVYIHATSKQ